jgi:hypothetical protein
MTVCAAVDYSCNLTATVLFWFIEQIIEPNITVDTVFTVGTILVYITTSASIEPSISNTASSI